MILGVELGSAEHCIAAAPLKRRPAHIQIVNLKRCRDRLCHPQKAVCSPLPCSALQAESCSDLSHFHSVSGPIKIPIAKKPFTLFYSPSTFFN